MNLVILGPQGCGKGTQAKLLEEKFDLFRIEMGEALRAVANGDTPFGKKIYETINVKRELVSSDLVIEVLHKELQKNINNKDVVFDGFPRRLDQIEVAEKILAENGKILNKAIFVNIPETESIIRISKRYNCAKCQFRFILGKDIKNPTDSCPECQGEIQQRPDDTPDGVRKRLAIFASETLPVINHYRQVGKLIEVDGTKSVEKVFQEIVKELEA